MIDLGKIPEGTPEPAPVIAWTLDRVNNLAALPKVAMEIMSLVDDVQAVAADFYNKIEQDPALTSRILKTVNSSFFGLPGEVDSLQQAVTMLGFTSVRNLAVAGSCHRLFMVDALAGGFHPSELWSHSVAVATAASLLMKRSRRGRPDQAYLAGIIHDIGVIIEMQIHREEFAKMIAALSLDREPITFRDAEARILGATHEDFGAGICRKWQFPKFLVDVAGTHHDPLSCEEDTLPFSAVVHVADVMAARLGIGFTGTVETDEVDPRILQLLQLSQRDLDEVADELLAALEESQAMSN